MVLKLKNLGLQALVAATLLVGATAAQAGNFVSLTNGVGGQLNVANGGLILGTNNSFADALYIETTAATYVAGFDDTRFIEEGGTGNVVASSIDYRTFNRGTTTGSGTLSLLDWSVTNDVPLVGGVAQATIYDFVYRDSADNKLVFASRYLNKVDNNQEVNFMFRYGFAGLQTASAWTFATNNDLRMYETGRTANFSFAGTVPFDGDAVRQKADISVTEGNPWSGLYFTKTNAEAYTVGTKAIGFFQAGEEGQVVAGGFIGGFIPTVAAVPEPETYALMLAGLGLVGFASRRKTSK